MASLQMLALSTVAGWTGTAGLRKVLGDVDAALQLFIWLARARIS
jgi:hypothetical protein